MITLPALPYALDALQPHLSKETLEFHYGKHHKAYVDKLNAAIPGRSSRRCRSRRSCSRRRRVREGVQQRGADLEPHVLLERPLAARRRRAEGRDGGRAQKAFGGVGDFVKKFDEAAANHFGSGWAWLVEEGDGALDVVATHDAANPLTDGMTPLLTCDVWEHAYYIDYRNARPSTSRPSGSW
jgi:Fe-Mn family superoxide dismutase